MKKTAVLGIGNLLLKDDGIGIHVVQRLSEDWINRVEVIDGGTCIPDLLGVFMDYERIVIVDSLKAGNEPGTLYKITPEEIGAYVKSNMSLHDVQVLDVLNAVNRMGYHPDVTVLGVEPAEISYDLTLSPVIEKQIPKIIECLEECLS